MLDKLLLVNQITRRAQTIAIFGPSGGGKTTIAATSPQPLFLDSNQGMTSVAGRPGFEHVAAIDVFGMKELDRAYNNFSGTGKVDWSKKYRSCVFDHFDDIQDLFLNQLGEAGAEKDDRRDPDETQQREWGIMGGRLRRYLRKFKKVRTVHKILICGEKEDRETGRMAPSMVGALKGQLPYLVDHTMYLRIGKNGKRYLHLDPGEGWYAKTRAWWIPERKIEVPFDNTTILTQLLDRIVAGPVGTSSRRAKTEK